MIMHVVLLLKETTLQKRSTSAVGKMVPVGLLGEAKNNTPACKRDEEQSIALN